MKLTMRAVLGWGVFAVLMLVGLDAAAQCSKDTDCKGKRVCLDGRCLDPAPAAPGYPTPAYQQPAPVYQQPAPVYQQPAPIYQQPAPVYQQPAPVYQQPAPVYQAAPGYPPAAYGAPYAPPVPAAPLQWYQTFYGHFGGILGFHGWGGMSVSGVEPSISGQFKGGIHMSGYAPLTSVLHLGGYFNYASGHMKLSYGGYSSSSDIDHYSVGISLKAGQRLAERIWLGFVGDLGFYAFDPEHGDAWYGLEISPRIHLDVLGFDFGVFKMGAFASLGPSFVPYVSGTYQGSDASAYIIYLEMLLGVTFGY